MQDLIHFAFSIIPNKRLLMEGPRMSDYIFVDHILIILFVMKPFMVLLYFL